MPDLITIPNQGDDFRLGIWDGVSYNLLGGCDLGTGSQASSVNPDNVHIAAGRVYATPVVDPLLKILKWEGGSLTQVASYTPGGAVRGCSLCEFSPDGQYLGTQFMGEGNVFRILKWDGSSLTSVATFTRPFGNILDCCWHPNGNYIGVLHTNGEIEPQPEGSRCFSVFKFDGSSLTLVDSYTPPTPIPPRITHGACAWSRDGKFIGLATRKSPPSSSRLQLFGWDGGLTELDEISLPDTPEDCDWNPSRLNDLAVAHYGSPYLQIFRRVGDDISFITSYTLPSYGHNCSWNPSGEYLAVGHNLLANGVEHLKFFSWNGSALTLLDGVVLSNRPYGTTFLKTYSQAPTAPTQLLCQGETNPTALETLTPYFSAIYNDPDSGDIAQHYRIQVTTASDFSGAMLWDSGKISMSDVNEGERCGNIIYAGTTLTEGTTYYWRIKFWDDEDNEGAWSSVANFRAIFTPTYPTDLRLSQCPEEFNPIEIKKDGIRFSAVYNDPNTEDIANCFHIQVNTNSNFTGNMLWDSGKTSMDDVNEGERCNEILYGGAPPEEDGSTYYWRIKFWDDEDHEGAWSDPNMFTMAGVKRRDELLSPIREIVIQREIHLA